tara:strand:- start:253 stop:1374 length:1122 start_codon:yes stop_codon:yes gene_type:complete
MISKIKTIIGRNITNARGWKTKRKIVVIESDDWGSIRMPNKKTLNNFLKLGYNLGKDPYCFNDTLANTEDLTEIFEVISSCQNERKQYPKFTFNTVMANPLFNDIKKSGFTEYFYEAFTETLKRYYPKESVFNLWQQGINENLLQPQFHGREHVNVYSWLRKLKEGNKPLLDAFDFGFWGIPKSLYGEETTNLQASFGTADPLIFNFLKENISVGLKLFEDVFNFKSKTFIANNYTFPENLYSSLKENGVIGIQSIKKQKLPQQNMKIRTKNIYTGKQNQMHQKYTVRNAFFEPSLRSKNFDNVKNCLLQIENAFFWKKPAIISSHRVNYIGRINKKNRQSNLIMLKELLSQIIRKWPEVEFLSSDELVGDIS